MKGCREWSGIVVSRAHTTGRTSSRTPFDGISFTMSDEIPGLRPAVLSNAARKHLGVEPFSHDERHLRQDRYLS